jgi:outer membrane receptor protein involved in Fe transport
MGKITLFLILLPTTLLADISGFVRDKKTLKGLSNVNILILSTSIGTTSDPDGFFTLTVTENKTYTINFSMIGYSPKKREITNPDENIVIYLEEKVLQTPGVTVFGKKDSEVREKNPLSIDELISIPLIKPDPIHAIQTMPGVTSLSDYFGWIQVRGGGGEENLYLLNDFEISNLYRLFGFESIVNPYSISRFELYPGGYSSKYGNKLSSVITIESKQFLGRNNLILWSDPTEFSLLYESKLSNKLLFYLSWDNSFIDSYLKNLDVAKDIILPKWGCFEERVSYIFDHSEIHLQILRERDYASISFPVESDILDEDTVSLDWRNNNELYGISWSHSTETFGTQEIHLSYNRFESNFITENLEDSRTTEEVTTKGIKVSLEKSIMEKHSLSCGISWKHVDDYMDTRLGYNETYLDLPENVSIMGDTNSYILGGYIESSSSLLEKVRLRTGCRLDRLELTHETILSPRITVSYKPRADVENYIFWGKYYQFPRLSYLSYSNLDASSSNHYIFGTTWNLDSSILLKLDIYYKEYDKLVTTRGNFDNSGYGYSYGFDLLLRRSFINNSFGWVSYSHIVSRRIVMDYPYLAPYKSDITHSLNFVYTFTFPLNLELSLRYKFSTGRPMTPFYGLYWLDDRWKVYGGDFHSERLPSYRRLDLKIAQNYTLWNNEFRFYITVLNLSNRKNIHDYIIYNENKNYRAIYMLPIVPFIGIEGRF